MLVYICKPTKLRNFIIILNTFFVKGQMGALEAKVQKLSDELAAERSTAEAAKVCVPFYIAWETYKSDNDTIFAYRMNWMM